MNLPTTSSNMNQPRDTASWTQDASPLKVTRTPMGALNLNVGGRRTTSPLQGFDQMWQKTFRIRLNGARVEPAEVITVWKERFGAFWPKWDHFYSH